MITSLVFSVSICLLQYWYEYCTVQYEVKTSWKPIFARGQPSLSHMEAEAGAQRTRHSNKAKGERAMARPLYARYAGRLPLL